MSGRPFEKTLKATKPPSEKSTVSIISKTYDTETATEVLKLSESTRRLLWRLNVTMFIFHTGFVAATFILGDTSLVGRLSSISLSVNNDDEADDDTDRLSFIGNYSDLTTSEANKKFPGWDDVFDAFLVPGVTLRDWGLPLTWLVGIFFFLSAFFHFGNAFLWWKSYVGFMEVQQNPYRWTEYTLSASTMILVIAYSSGINIDLELLMIFVLIATTMFFGHLTETVNKKSEGEDKWALPLCQRLTPHLMGYLPQITAWFVIVFNFISNSENAPDFVQYIIWGQLGLFFSFGFVQLAVILRKPSKYVNGEIAYQFLSIIAKGFLGVIMLTNVVFLASWQCIVEEVRERLPSDYC